MSQRSSVSRNPKAEKSRHFSLAFGICSGVIAIACCPITAFGWLIVVVAMS